jgi:hypothetical protein
LHWTTAFGHYVSKNAFVFVRAIECIVLVSGVIIAGEGLNPDENGDTRNILVEMVAHMKEINYDGHAVAFAEVNDVYIWIVKSKVGIGVRLEVAGEVD